MIAVNSTDVIQYCANSSTEALCICTDEALTGDDCRTSCPGLIGPIYDSINDSYFFQECSNTGVCDHMRFTCQCTEGYGGDGCEIEYQEFNFYKAKDNMSKSIFVIWVLSLIVLNLYVIAAVIWMWMNTKYKSVKILAARMTTLFSVGLILLCVGTGLLLIQPKDLSSYTLYVI